ncbi:MULTISPECIES: TetR/AcrR family transcriptional regulator [Brevibacillus]|uniref:TetR family transcriptional regulator n=1 Tax=Brevibacillus parabrevis TaxID=54914 RepID=A0A4Y3PMU5_BREPA|nr:MULTISPECIES: TetR/AcrR family transcriptional regulator [Brevibacillus]MDR4999001.1 TetR/AcrR family transcriptional regulator [Brevibacillus parabrevis]MED2254447.1 TetR/AcrR family transcriptional regulator [Brevibacillus parabrevis]RNB93905.1 TetR/AcrR family transcriptional regulator [Brevibacillus parabrevis]UED67381.1 TetR/AcrR family transcriptional regulator [Brevibacillus sp. HD3.3A]WDV93641.1 TetR/AcrR family transcriptional regulator [Brevibacillus parabrevis]
MNHPRSAIKEARLRAILDAATELLIQKPTASLNEIAEYAGIGIATLHRYIESREQLMLQLGLRALQVVGESMRQIPLDEEKLEDYIPALIEALIPLGDKIYFLTHDATLYYSEEIIAAEHKLKEPVCYAIRLLQEKGIVRQDMSVDWVWNALYMLVFIAWQQVQDGRLAKRPAAQLVTDTLFHGVSAR